MIRLCQAGICDWVGAMSGTAHSNKSYHHGDLPQALIQEGARLLAEKGVAGFSLRQVAERAGVSVAAPAHHFGNAKGLLTAIATEGFAKLAARLQHATAARATPEDQVIAMCHAYVAMAQDEPGYAVIMFRLDALDDTNAAFLTWSFHAFDVFRAAVEGAATEQARGAQTLLATKTLWAAMHGLTSLRMIQEEGVDEVITFAVSGVLDQVN